jgi:hypothetical protein
MFHHGENSIVELVVMDVEHNLFSMQCGLFASTDDFGDVDPRPEEFEMFHSLLRLVLGVENCELSEHRHVCPLETETSLHQCNEFVKEAVVFVLLNQLLQFFCMDNQVETTDLSETEFSLVDTCLVDLFPHPAISNIIGESDVVELALRAQSTAFWNSPRWTNVEANRAQFEMEVKRIFAA